MRNYGTLSLAARVACLREHHIYNDSNTLSSQIWTLMNIQDFHNVSFTGACLSRIAHGSREWNDKSSKHSSAAHPTVYSFDLIPSRRNLTSLRPFVVGFQSSNCFSRSTASLC